MNSLGTVKAALADSLVTNSTLKEAFELASFVTDRSKRFKDVALNPDQKHKLRRVLNHFLIPDVKPKFVDDEDTEAIDANEMPDDWLAKTDEDLKTPLRMIDIDTMNMVPTYSLGIQDQYCIVSHSWKGSEITYGDFTQAKTFEPSKKAANAESGEPSNDVNNTVAKCKADIEELEKKITSALPSVKATSDGKRPEDIATLLEWYADANGAEYSLGSAQKQLHEATSTTSSAYREAKYYRSLWETITALDADTNSEQGASSAHGKEMKKVLAAIEDLTKDAEKKRQEATEKNHKAVATRAEEDSKVAFFEQNRELSYGIEALLTALQHIRSSRKILESITQARKLFDQHFPKGGKRYVWLDTCCINKGDTYELTESLALMGDWYSNADLCLVHLDTPRDERAWIEEWKYWKNPSYVPIPLNMTEYDKIGADGSDEEKNQCQIEWATRGWTLQELVLSKVTYYVNSHWQNLYRPVEVLGPLYFLRPFLLRYIQHPYVKAHKKVSEGLISQLKELLSPEFIKPDASKEEELTTMLLTLGFLPPRGLQEKLAESQIGKAALSAARQLPNTINDFLAKKSISDDTLLKELINSPGNDDKISLFNHLLAELVERTDKQILEDRKFIAKFSKVMTMSNWIAGDGLGNSSAITSLVTASDRQTTVATDQAYSLMGILGVRFPAFPAEGLPKALARLLDEVVVANNDVSVFNWSGKHRGSPLHGRSLYPASIDAFVEPTNHPSNKSKAQTSKKILDLFRAQRVRQSKTANNINMLLSEILALSKKLPEQCSAFEELSKLATAIKNSTFDKLETLVDDLKAIAVKLQEFVPDESDEDSKNQSLAGKLGNTMERVDSFSKGLKFEAPKFEVPKFEKPKLGSFGWGKKSSDKPAEKAEPSEPATPPPPAVEEKSEAKKKYEELNEAIINLTAAILSTEKAKESEADSDKDVPLDDKVAEKNEADLQENSVPYEPQEEKRMSCPNPITVSSGGIRGIFDIQRIIVNMVDPDILRSKVRTAVRGQKIDGWCTISTGLSMTLVAFSAERDVLAQQLDLADVIKTYLEPEVSAPQDASALNVSKETTQVKKDDSLISDIKQEKTPEQAKVARMINFVQKQDLHGIAGEWVLVRFSGTPGAKWFLCLLELGAGNDFYGHRIPTDEFSFEDAAPERGITEYWHQFTKEKKARTCDTLDMFLNRQRMMQNAGKNFDSLSKVENPSQNSGESGWETAFEILQNVSFDKVVNLGKMAGQGVGGLGAELWANHLEGRIEKGALKRVPVSLRTPVRDLDHNRKLLPVMFHAGREMHMF